MPAAEPATATLEAAPGAAAEAAATLNGAEVVAINVGLAGFGDAMAAAGRLAGQVDWLPPAGGDEAGAAGLSRLYCAAVCCGTWARVTVGRFRSLALKTF